MAQMATSWFEPLPSETHIRLLHVPRTTCDKGRLHERSISGIEVFDIDATPPYHALSYTWGETKPTQTITLKGNVDLLLTESLKEGYPYILAKCKTDYLFIDQLCVNQNDPNERSKQVALMAKIFSRAESVLIWLGPRIEHQGILVWILDQLGHEESASAFQPPEQENKWPSTRTKYNKFRETVSRDGAEEVILQTLLDIFRLPWFCRVWVVQEAVLASRASFILGSLVITPLGLCQIVLVTKGLMKDYEDRLLNGEAGLRPFHFMMRIRDEDGRFVESFDRVLENLRTSTLRGHLHATDLRDYVYGLLGLREEFTTNPLNPDYTLSASQVFTQAANYFTTSRSNLDILNLCEGIGERTRGSLLPSWVPDWSTALRHRFGIYPPAKEKEFSASKISHIIPCQSNVWSELRVKGKVIDEIQLLHTRCLKYLRALFTGAVSWPWLSPTLIAKLARSLSTKPYIASSGHAEVRILSMMFHWALRGHNRVSESKAKDITTLLSLFGTRKRSVEPAMNSWGDWYRDAALHTSDDTRNDLVPHMKRLSEGTCAHGNPYRSCEQNECQEFYFINVSGIIPLYQLEDDAEVFSSASGALGLAHKTVEAGDVVAILHGFNVPAVLRRNLEGKYQYVTGCYLENAMYGEAMYWSEEEADEIVLV